MRLNVKRNRDQNNDENHRTFFKSNQQNTKLEQKCTLDPVLTNKQNKIIQHNRSTTANFEDSLTKSTNTTEVNITKSMNMDQWKRQ